MAKSSSDTTKGKTVKSQQNNKKNKTGKTKSKKTIFKRILLAVLIIILLLGGFFMGIYLRILDTDKLNKSLHLYDWPIIGQNFVKPVDDSSDKKDEAIDDKKQDITQSDNKAQSKPVILTKKQLEKQKKDREAAVNKRIGKLARIYGQMDPKKAADILEPLSDNVVVSILQKMDDSRSAKVMENLDSGRAAQITQTLYNGITPPTMSQLDQAESGASNAQASQQSSGQ